jgi:hypothetical protein
MRYCESLSSSIASADHALPSSFRVPLRPNPFIFLFLAEPLKDGECARVKVGVRLGLFGGLWCLDASS